MQHVVLLVELNGVLQQKSLLFHISPPQLNSWTQVHILGPSKVYVHASGFVMLEFIFN